MDNIELLEPISNEENKLKKYYMIPVNIFIYAFLGLKTITVDLIMYIYNFFSWNLTKTYEESKDTLKSADAYERTKNIKSKKEKKYEYSARKLEKLENEKELLLKDLQSDGATRSKVVRTYFFKIRETNGKVTTGVMNGLSKLDINAFLLNEGYEVFSIKTSKWIEFMHSDAMVIGSNKMKTKELIFFITQLSTYLKAGLTLSNSVRILSRQMSKDKVKSRAFQSISYELSLGEEFSTSMEKQKNMFPPLLINMIKAAEASGTLIQTLDEMTEYYTDLDNTKKQMISAITYPAIVMFFAVSVIFFILVYVVPQFTEIYETSNADITGVTLAVITISNFLKSNGLYLILILILSLITIIVLYKKLKSFRTMVQIILMRIPVIKDIIIYNELAIFSKTFASLLKNNVFITDSMNILSKITSNEIYKSILYKTINNIVVGEKISEAFENHWAVPDVAYYMIVTGESTGELDKMMEKVSEYYQELHKNVVNNLKSFIEPILTAGLAIIVGFIIIAVIVPMYGIIDTLQ